MLKYDYRIVYFCEDGSIGEFETIAISDDDATEQFEIETGYGELSITDSERCKIDE